MLNLWIIILWSSSCIYRLYFHLVSSVPLMCISCSMKQYFLKFYHFIGYIVWFTEKPLKRRKHSTQNEPVIYIPEMHLLRSIHNQWMELWLIVITRSWCGWKDVPFLMKTSMWSLWICHRSLFGRWTDTLVCFVDAGLSHPVDTACPYRPSGHRTWRFPSRSWTWLRPCETSNGQRHHCGCDLSEVRFASSRIQPHFILSSSFAHHLEQCQFHQSPCVITGQCLCIHFSISHFINIQREVARSAHLIVTSCGKFWSSLIWMKIENSQCLFLYGM